MSEIVVTRGIREELDLRNLVVIAETIRTYEEEEDFDEFQVFDIKDNYIINKQEIPEREKKISAFGSSTSQSRYCTGWPCSASKAARCTATVVFPVPPFPLAMASEQRFIPTSLPGRPPARRLERPFAGRPAGI